MSKKSMSWWRSSPPPTLHLIYEGKPVAELKRIKMGDEQWFYFRYLAAFKLARLAPLPGLPDSDEGLWSRQLWAYFAERIPDIHRPEIEALMRERKINRFDELEMLEALGSQTVTDPFEIRRAEVA